MNIIIQEYSHVVVSVIIAVVTFALLIYSTEVFGEILLAFNTSLGGGS